MNTGVAKTCRRACRAFLLLDFPMPPAVNVGCPVSFQGTSANKSLSDAGLRQLDASEITDHPRKGAQDHQPNWIDFDQTGFPGGTATASFGFVAESQRGSVPCTLHLHNRLTTEDSGFTAQAIKEL
jgi:hypothetical protein